MRGAFDKLKELLSPEEQRKAIFLFAMILVMALLDVGGVASIMPLMAILANPEVVGSNPVLSKVYHALDFSSAHRFLIFVCTAIFLLLLLAIAFKAWVTYAQLRFVMMREYSIGQKLVAGYLHQPYVWFLNRHSADLGKTVLSEVNKVIGGALMPMMQIVAQSAVAVLLLVLLISVDPGLAMIVGSVLGLAYAGVYKLMRGFLSRIGTESVEANRMRFTVLAEAFGGIKEIKVGGLENCYVERFSRPARIYAGHQASSQIIAQMPRYALEALAFGGMLVVVVHLMAESGGLEKALPILALYAFAGYRLMPALQQIYVSITALRFACPSLNALHADLGALVSRSGSPGGDESRFALSQAIVLRDLSFSYPKTTQPALGNINIAIPAHSTIGLVGATGSGKTTMVDVILGLLEPTSGALTVDGVLIKAGNLRQWQGSLGYVPQHIFLADDTIAANIAFGVASDKIDHVAVERAAQIANLHDFVRKELPEGYSTTVGERGVRLSGGQRQRIGIARALYHNPQVLILDEATSALDNLTEQAVMEAVHNLGKQITIILIAHRLTTVRECDQIFMLRGGQVVAQGRYDELMEQNETFRAMRARS